MGRRQYHPRAPRWQHYNAGMFAETAYLFRHALLRDAAYDLHVPSEKKRLHGAALEILEQVLAAPPRQRARTADGEPAYTPHAVDAFAAELAQHARAAGFHDALYCYLLRAAHHADAGFRPAEVVRHCEELAQCAEPVLRPAILRRAADAALLAEQPEHGLQLATRGANEAEALADVVAHARLISTQASLHRNRMRVKEAEECYLRALAMHARSGDETGEGLVRGNYASLLFETGRRNEALQQAEQALAIDRRVGNRRSEGVVLVTLSGIQLETRQPQQAEENARAAVEIMRQTGNRRWEGMAQANLANCYLETNRLDEAEQAYEAALAIHRETGNLRMEGIALGNLAFVYQDRGRLEVAEQTLLRALAIHREVGNLRSEGFVLGTLADLYATTNRHPLALQAYAAAMPLHRKAQNRGVEGHHGCKYALVLLENGHTEEARSVWQQASPLLAQRDSQGMEFLAARMQELCQAMGIPPLG